MRIARTNTAQLAMRDGIYGSETSAGFRDGKKEKDATVKKSVLQSIIAARRSEREGCMSLPFTILFFFIYTMDIMSHQDVEPVYQAESSLRGLIEEYSFDTAASRTIYSIREASDFWHFMREAFVPGLIQQTDHRGNDLDQQKWGTVLMKNRLKGGILFEQFRSQEYMARHNMADHLYFPGEGVISQQSKATPRNESNIDPRILVENFLALATLEGSEGEDRRLRGSGVNNTNVGVSDSSELSTTAEMRYSFFLFEHEPISILMQRMRHLEDQHWIDQYTTQVNIKMLFWNEDAELIQHLKIRFLFPSAGGIFIKMFFQSSYSNAYKTSGVLVLDIIWLLLIFKITFLATRDMYHSFRDGNIRVHFQDIWVHIEWGSIFWGFVIIGMFTLERSMVQNLLEGLISNNDQYSMGDGNVNQEYLSRMETLHQDAQNVSDMSMWYRLVLANYTMMIMLRFFKAFKGHPRLAIVTNTIVRASTDLFHFVIVFLSAFLTYTFAGTVLFGRRLKGFSTFQKSFGSCFAIACGDFDWNVLSKEHVVTTTLWFWSFMILVFMIMLNMVLAIVMDVYTSVRVDAVKGDPIWVNVFEVAQKAKLYPVHVYHKITKQEASSQQEVSDKQIIQALNTLGPSVKISKLKSLLGLSNAQTDRIMEEIDSWEKQQKDVRGMSMTDAIKKIRNIDIKVDDLIKRIDFAHSQDPRLQNVESFKAKATRAKRKFKRAIFSAFYSGQLMAIADALQSHKLRAEVQQQDLNRKIQKVTSRASLHATTLLPQAAEVSEVSEPASMSAKMSGQQNLEESKKDKHHFSADSIYEVSANHEMVLRDVCKEVQVVKSQTEVLLSLISDMSSCMRTQDDNRIAKKCENEQDAKEELQADELQAGVPGDVLKDVQAMKLAVQTDVLQSSIADNNVLKEVQTVKLQTEALQSSVADMSSCLKHVVSVIETAESPESPKETGNRSHSVRTRGRRKREISPTGGAKTDCTAQPAQTDFGSAFQSVERRLDDISDALKEMKPMETMLGDVSNMLKNLKNMKEIRSSRSNAPEQGYSPKNSGPIADTAINLSADPKILEMCLLVKDLHQAMNKSHVDVQPTTASRLMQQSANGSFALGFLLREIRNITQQTQPLRKMLMEVLQIVHSMGDVNAASVMPTQLLNNTGRSRKDADADHDDLEQASKQMESRESSSTRIESSAVPSSKTSPSRHEDVLKPAAHEATPTQAEAARWSSACGDHSHLERSGAEAAAGPQHKVEATPSQAFSFSRDRDPENSNRQTQRNEPEPVAAESCPSGSGNFPASPNDATQAEISIPSDLIPRSNNASVSVPQNVPGNVPAWISSPSAAQPEQMRRGDRNFPPLGRMSPDNHRSAQQLMERNEQVGISGNEDVSGGVSMLQTDGQSTSLPLVPWGRHAGLSQPIHAGDDSQIPRHMLQSSPWDAHSNVSHPQSPVRFQLQGPVLQNNAQTPLPHMVSWAGTQHLWHSQTPGNSLASSGAMPPNQPYGNAGISVTDGLVRTYEAFPHMTEGMFQNHDQDDAQHFEEMFINSMNEQHASTPQAFMQHLSQPLVSNGFNAAQEAWIAQQHTMQDMEPPLPGMMHETSEMLYPPFPATIYRAQ
eukprot:gnl/MRDRNA2_/MRDRNA2_31720_c0_seq1.p1 gnl/MRDRNA2_/MRDRNA2_31720_c0~~gnl/MRDRNA2_/MRDRNA2_31720_c0_seq1.p1  ORF type:complete len:1604 (+),score=291.19 gnl/MRDRNA2_/MRDRNA2_31720_c0_seq1:146-4957(+)